MTRQTGPLRAAPGGRRIPGTRFVPPALAPAHLTRRRLHRQLDAALDTPLAVVVAPPGSGKTALVRAWVTDLAVPWVWVSLDPEDDDPAHIISVLASAFSKLDDRLAEHATPGSRQAASDDEQLSALVDDLLDVFVDDVVVVLDEVDHLRSESTAQTMRWLLRHLPPAVHVVAISRSNPPWPLARLRAQGSLVEIRAEELRFTTGEVAGVLERAGHSGLDFDLVAAATDRIGGWAAALHLLVDAMEAQPQSETDVLLRFDASDRSLAAFLKAEVLGPLPPELVQFIEDVIVLDRLTPERCDALLQRTDSASYLQALDRFEVLETDPIGNGSRLLPILRQHVQLALERDDRERLRAQRRRGAELHERWGEVEAAVELAIAAGDVAGALALVVEHNVDLRNAGQAPAIRRWLAGVPGQALTDPAILIDAGFIAAVVGDFATGQRYLARAEATLADAGEPLGRTLAWRRAAVSAHLGDVDDALAHDSQARAIDGVPSPRDELAHSQAWLQIVRVLGGAERYDEAMARYEAGTHQFHGSTGSTEHGRLGVLAELRFDQGELRDAAAHADEALHRWQAEGSRESFSVLDAMRAKAGLDLESGRRDSAAELVGLAEELAAHIDRRTLAVARTRIARATLLLAQGDPDGAVGVLDDLLRSWSALTWPHPGPALVRVVDGARCRALLALGDIDAAETAARHLEGPSSAILGARIALARGDLDRVASHQWPDTLTRRQAIEAALVTALSCVGRDEGAAVTAANEALRLGAGVGFLTTYVAERSLLPIYRLVAARHPSPTVAVVLGAARSAAASAVEPPKSELTEPLTERERQIVALLTSDMPYAEVAAHLYVSPNTLKTHRRSIYRKLGVHSRLAAIHEARRLGLLS